MDDISASDMIKWQEEVIKLIKELTISNELSLIQTQTPEQIRKNIREIMKTRTDNNYIEEYDIYRIYEFFFELTEADINNRKQEQINRIMQFIDESHGLP
jgi:hemerythrin superfamily protein